MVELLYKKFIFIELYTKSSKIMLISGTNTGNMITSLAIKTYFYNKKNHSGSLFI